MFVTLYGAGKFRATRKKNLIEIIIEDICLNFSVRYKCLPFISQGFLNKFPLNKQKLCMVYYNMRSRIFKCGYALSVIITLYTAIFYGDNCYIV